MPLEKGVGAYNKKHAAEHQADAMSEEEASKFTLDTIEARLNAATPGPWVRAARGGEQSHDSIWPADVTALDRIAFIENTDDHPGDADLIAHAPEDLRALIAEVRRLTGELEPVRAERARAAAVRARVLAQELHAAGPLPGETAEEAATYDRERMPAAFEQTRLATVGGPLEAPLDDDIRAAEARGFERGRASGDARADRSCRCDQSDGPCVCRRQRKKPR